MTSSRLSWLALAATIVACALVDGGFLLLAWWLTGNFLAGAFGFFFLGGPFTLFMAGPMYKWFKSAFGARAVA
jgi:hypothetical protein